MIHGSNFGDVTDRRRSCVHAVFWTLRVRNARPSQGQGGRAIDAGASNESETNTMTDKFIVMRKDGDDYRSMGPVAHPLSLERATEEISALAARFPHQEFRMFADVGGAIRQETIALNLRAPNVELPAVAGVTRISKARVG